MDDGLMTIEGLTEAVRAALEGEDAPTNGQVRAVPDVRTIRYYTSLGLLDRPAELRGRTAYYSDKHALQLVAVKRLQGEGLSLAEVQERVAGLSEARLRKLTGIVGPLVGLAPRHPAPRGARDEGAPTASVPALPPAASAAPAREAEPARDAAPPARARPAPREDFWRTPPAETARSPEPLGSLTPAIEALRLDARALLVIEGTRPLTDDERRRLRALAAPLLEALDTLAAARAQDEEG